MEVKMSISYGRIKKTIDDWDPIELLITHAPPDEYDSESREIFNMLQNADTMDTQTLSQAIHDVFSRRFGSNVFIKGLEECSTIAQKIFM